MSDSGGQLRSAEELRDASALEVDVRHCAPSMWRVWIVRAQQSFRLDYKGTKRDCDWYADNLRFALGLISHAEHEQRIRKMKAAL